MIRKLYATVVAKFIRVFNNLPLREKLLICYGTLLVFSVSMVGLFSYHNMKRYIYDQTVESYRQALVQMEMNIDSRLDKYDEILGNIISDKTFIYALARQYESPAEYSYEYLDKIMKIVDIKNKYKDIVDIIIYKNNASLPEDGQYLLEMENLHGIWWFDRYYSKYRSTDVNDIINIGNTKIWIATDEHIIPPYVRDNVKDKKISRQNKIAIIKPVILNNSKVVGVIEIYVNYHSIFSELDTEISGQRNRIFIIDQAGKLVYQNHEANKENPSVFEEMVKRLEESPQGSFSVGENHNSHTVLHVKGRNSKWTYCMGIPMRQLLSNAWNVRNFTVVVVLVSILVSVLIGILIAGFISARITTLSRKMDEVENLTLNVQVDVEGKDEIGNLAHSFNRMILRIQELIGELTSSQKKRQEAELKALESQKRHREAELKALQSQINPHFLYNTLATISWMALDANNKKIFQMVKSLATFYRLALNKGREFIPIEQEIEQVQSYGVIQKIRLEGKIDVTFAVDVEICKLYTLKLILQPFLENAILHGAERKPDRVTHIVVKGFRQGNRIVFEVIDDGVGMREVPQPENYPTSGGYGIRNVHEKIQLQYGKEYGVELFSRIGVGTKATVIIPVIDVNPYAVSDQV